MKEKVKLRKNVAFMPALAWALAIDALDIAPNALNVALSLIGVGLPVGLALDTAFDVFQTFVALLVFEDSGIALLNADFILPQGLDLFPSYTARVLARERFGVG